MYKPLQKKSSSWASASIQKKSKNFSKPGRSAIQQKPNSQEIPNYSTTAADLLAANVMRSLENKEQDEPMQMSTPVQRAFQGGGTQASGDLESRLNASQGGGNALAPEVRAFMEPRFGADFSAVRVHMGSEAVQMNRELGAQAFTHGSNVYFGEGKSPGNNELTAHELTHVVQQTGAVQRLCDECEAELSDKEDKQSVQAKLELGQPGDKYEQEADAVAHQVVDKINAPTAEPSVQRQSESKPPAPLLDEAPNSPAYQTALEEAIKVNKGVALGKKQLNAGGLVPFVSFLKGSLTFDKKKLPDLQKELAKELAPKLAAWQSNNGLTANGQLDVPTLEKLKDIRYGRKDWTQQDADERIAIEAAKKQANDLKADPNSSVRAAIVSLAASQIGQVNNLNRGDGKKYGWERVKAFYDTTIPGYSSNPANLKRIQASGPPEKVGAWSWCGIFALWAVKSVTGNGSWEQKEKGGSPAGLAHVPKAADPTLANARPGDILYIAEQTHHFILAEPVRGDMLVTIDGAGDYEGINRTTHPLSSILGYYQAVHPPQPT